MNIKVSLKNSNQANKVSDKGFELSCIGHVWEKELLSSLHTKDLEFKDAVGVIKNITGFFSLVYQNEKQLIASVDHIRSHPIFYGQTNTTFYLSDCAEWVREMVKDISMDEQAKAEFQLAGYVTGRDTLYKNVKQLQAGECLVYANNQLAVERYYIFEHSEPENYNEEALLVKLDVVAKDSIQRLIEYANGRQIVIPLSGGYDSRLIAALLKEANYDNILTFTYGKKGNKEAAYSKIVAESLGLKWHFVEYTEALWQQAWQTEERKCYQLFGSGWSSIPHVQDWLAVKIMKEQGIVDSSAVFAPGHSGDMVAGSHIPSFIHENLTTRYRKEDLIEHLFNKHYSLTNHKNIKLPKTVLKNKINESILLKDSYNAEDFANECEKYNWQNRQSKFIINSVRVYEFFDYDWWIPLWDKEFIRFFECLPLELRNHEWYKQYVQDKYLSNSNGDMSSDLGNASEIGLLRRAANLKIIESLKLKGLLRKVYKNLFKPKSHLGIESRYDSEEYQKLTEQGYSSNGKAAYFFLQEFK